MTQPVSVHSTSTASVAVNPASHLRREYEGWQSLLAAQPNLTRHFIEAQARRLAEAITQRDRLTQLRFTLPDQVAPEPAGQLAPIPPEFREQMAGGLMDRLARTDISVILRQRLAELEGSPNRALAMGAGLMRHAIALHMVQGMLPAGRTALYRAAEGEEIPTIPVDDGTDPDSAITATSDAIVEEGGPVEGRGELLVPFVPAARRHYLPQWVAFDDEGQLLVGSVGEAEAQIASMQNFLTILHAAVALAPYMVADEIYQQKRRGMLSQLVNQGRVLARYETAEIIQTIRRRAAAQDLNRGLSLSLPYFDDQTLRMESHPFEIIPAGRIMFVPAFVVRAARAEQAKVAQDTRLNASTRKYLLFEFALLETAFATGTLNS